MRQESRGVEVKASATGHEIKPLTILLGDSEKLELTQEQSWRISAASNPLYDKLVAAADTVDSPRPLLVPPTILNGDVDVGTLLRQIANGEPHNHDHRLSLMTALDNATRTVRKADGLSSLVAGAFASMNRK